MSKRNFYRLGNDPTRAECEALDVKWEPILRWRNPANGVYISTIRTGEFRTPHKGEWYLSGATPLAYRAPNDLGTEYHIVALVAVQRETKIIETVLRRANHDDRIHRPDNA